MIKSHKNKPILSVYFLISLQDQQVFTNIGTGVTRHSLTHKKCILQHLCLDKNLYQPVYVQSDGSFAGQCGNI